MLGRLVAVMIVGVAVVGGICLAEGENAAEPALVRSKEQAQTDAQALLALDKKYTEGFRWVTGGVTIHETTVEGMVKKSEEDLAKLETLETGALPELRPVLARITQLWAKPGAEEAARQEKDFDEAQFAFDQSGEIEWNLKMAATNNDVGAARNLPEEFDGSSTRYTNLVRGVCYVARTRAANAEYLASHVKQQPAITFFVQDKRVGIMKEWRTVLQWALKFDPTNAYANERLATIDSDIAALEKAVEKEIDDKTWAGHVGDFPGPGSVGELAKASLEALRKDKAWGNQGPEPEKNADGTAKPGVEVVAVAVRGGWRPAEHDLFGRVISWGLPIHLAVTKPDLKAKNIARVYELTIVTVQGAPGKVQKAPPFDGAWVGNSWMMRLSKVPK